MEIVLSNRARSIHLTESISLSLSLASLLFDSEQAFPGTENPGSHINPRALVKPSYSLV